MARFELDSPELGSLCPVSREGLILNAFCPEFLQILVEFPLKVSYECLFHKNMLFKNLEFALI